MVASPRAAELTVLWRIVTQAAPFSAKTLSLAIQGEGCIPDIGERLGAFLRFQSDVVPPKNGFLCLLAVALGLHQVLHKLHKRAGLCWFKLSSGCHQPER